MGLSSKFLLQGGPAQEIPPGAEEQPREQKSPSKQCVCVLTGKIGKKNVLILDLSLEQGTEPIPAAYEHSEGAALGNHFWEPQGKDIRGQQKYLEYCCKGRDSPQAAACKKGNAHQQKGKENQQKSAYGKG